MSGHMKKRHIERKHKNRSSYDKRHFLYVLRGNRAYAIPKEIAEQYIINLSDNKTSKDNKNIPANELFTDFQQEFTSAGALLKGIRARENLTQVDFATRIGATQANLSKMENGKRPIGKKMAKRIGDEFGVNYRYFLE